MHFQLGYALQFVVLVNLRMVSHGLDYSDLQALGVVCAPQDSCDNFSPNRTFWQKTCECDSRCSIYNDCCIDAHQQDMPLQTSIRGLKCLPEGSPSTGVYVLSKCSRNWIGAIEIQNKCEYINDNSDPILSSPVTDIVQNITYKNHYCAVCNYANTTNLTPWIIKVVFDSLLTVSAADNITDEFVQEQLTYKRTYPHRNKWGIYVWDGNLARQVFHPGRLSYKLPGYVESNVRFCRPYLVSTCSPTWRRNTVRRKCVSYMAMVQTDNQNFRNPHCALCNNINLNDLVCPTIVLARRKSPMSFTLLLDVNLSDGDRVGEVNPCSSGEKYDSFFKKCRKVVCGIPGYRVQKDKCVPAK